ncbi:MAG: hypothetical protein NVS1B7_1790 [Candidatus Saccharimonadales bacterium]
MYKKLLVVGVLFALATASIVITSEKTQALFEGAKQAACSGIALQENSTPCNDTGNKINGVIKLVVNLLSLFVGVAAVIMLIVGGLKYVTSQGESSNTAGAKNTILYAIIGLVIVALAQLIVRFTLNKVTSLPSSCKPPQMVLADGSCG